ncbi:MAG: uroporphyrinogen-III C-methyltransferase [Syntrophomonadaceae bacterium]|jgi:uroporphyrinogen III methyltransferase/synthase|nr:uroporphyrinogen-III C-methyltransferase [Syntrophomonadaceae bacterium]
MSSGLVYLIGAGPGDPGLLTIRAQKVLQEADVVIYDRLVGEEILAMASPEAELIYVGKAAGRHSLPQEEINKLLVKKAQEGKKVARLKGGDPFLFGRGGEEAVFLREHGLDFEVIPGITSAIAVPAYAGIPVTHRDITSSFAVITGHEKPEKAMSSIQWDKISTGVGTLVFLMGVENLPAICHELVNNGRSPQTPIALIRWGTLPQQQVLTGTLENIVEKVEAAQFKPPAVIIVGEVVRLREQLKWIENKPLWGKRVLVTRARAQASSLVARIRQAGGQATECPSIVIQKEVDRAALDTAFKSLEYYDWLVFTSVNGVDIFLEEMLQYGLDIRDLKGIRLVAIGPATRKRLEEHGLRVDIMPERFQAEGILEELQKSITPGQWVLLPRAIGARPILPETLKNWGVYLHEIGLYRAVAAQTANPGLVSALLAGDFDYLTFTSSSTVTNFVKMIGEGNVSAIDAVVKVACIGPITAQTASDLGFTINVMAREYTIEGLVEAIIEDALNSTREERMQ